MERPHIDPAPQLAGIHDVPPDEAARRLRELIHTAQSPEQALSNDRGIIDALADYRGGEELLAELDLAALATLGDRAHQRLGSEPPGDEAGEARRLAWTLLDILRRSPVLRRISDAGATDEWSGRILRLVEASHFTFGQLFHQRCTTYRDRTLFVLAGGDSLSWQEVARRVALYGRGLLAFTDNGATGPVAILSANRLEMALVDMACLAAGIPNLMIPATATETDVAYILEHAGASILIAGSDLHVKRGLAVRAEVPDLRHVISLGSEASKHPEVLRFEDVVARAGEVSAEELAQRRNRVAIDDLATVMYTSGTTGTPKGIAFSQRNLVFKRFARALALPEIGDQDRFLSFLPLFHTFGRFLELQGSVFWGATYCFAGDPSMDTLARKMKTLKPSIFISIPMKWIQLHELIHRQVDELTASDEEISRELRRITGGRLRWGLSAAGYLDPEIFRFFQANGIELMSGFGMTEATGGITMTPPGQYREDSLGQALPGIDLKLAEDGELLVQGPYVMQGYFRPPDGQQPFDADGWFATGDLMEVDEEGFLRIVDRKKEIYKNVQGQTVAPQKIENLFRDFHSVSRVFLIGDHRPYNTALIYPNFDFEQLDLAAMSPEELKAHFRSLVVTANTFLAPYERIVDFAIIDRDFSTEKEELTAKGTYRRKVIERKFIDTIRLLYRRTILSVGSTEVLVNNWIFQALGITSQSLRSEGNRLLLGTNGNQLELRRLGPQQVQVGSVVYSCSDPAVDLGVLLSTPWLWLGNSELVDFADLGPELRNRHRSRQNKLQWSHRATAYTATEEDREWVEAIGLKQTVDLLDLHRAALLLEAEQTADALLAVRALRHLGGLEESGIVAGARRVLRRAARAHDPEVARRAFEVLVRSEASHRYQETITSFLDHQPALLNEETITIIAEENLEPEQLTAFLHETRNRCLREDPDSSQVKAAVTLLELAARYGSGHPSVYRLLRAFLTRIAITSRVPEVRLAARRHRAQLENEFRSWLGTPSRIAVDPETGLEYRWEDVVAFADDVPQEDRVRILDALRSTSLLREVAFLFSGGTTLRLADILPGGVWIRQLASGHGKAVYRIAVRTRLQGTFDLAVNLNHDMEPSQVEEELDWLIVCGDAGELWPLVEDFGGYWPQQEIWSEEFVPGETLDRALRRLAKRPEEEERITGLWPFAAWSAIGAFIDFWNRTGRRMVITDPLPGNVIVPTHDYHTGARLVSIAARQPFESPTAMLLSLHDTFINQVESDHPKLAGLVGWDIVFSALLGMIGEADGLVLLEKVVGNSPPPRHDLLHAACDFVASVRRRGFLPRRLYFAAKRYRRWQALNPDATRFARARTLHELYAAYGLERLHEAYPEARARFYRETIFRDASESLAGGLEEIITQLRSGSLSPAELSAAVADLRTHLKPGTDEDFFLAHLSFPHLRPEDEASFVASRTGDSRQSEMVVTLEDSEGDPFRIRHALNPKEVGRLHRLFLAAKLPLSLRPEHRFLIALNERDHLIGGLFYEVDEEERSAHMERVVVAERFRRKGVAGALIEELCNRLRAAGVQSLTTGFFRPQFFYRYGFTVERRYAGLVRRLVGEEAND